MPAEGCLPRVLRRGGHLDREAGDAVVKILPKSPPAIELGRSALVAATMRTSTWWLSVAPSGVT